MKYIENICSFEVNDINIFIECNKKTSVHVFSRMQSTCENLNVTSHEMKIFMIFTEKSLFVFFFVFLFLFYCFYALARLTS